MSYVQKINGFLFPRLPCNITIALQMRDMNHENVNQFIGLCTEAPHVSIAMVYCTRRSLRVMQRYRINFIILTILFLSHACLSQLRSLADLVVPFNGGISNHQQTTTQLQFYISNLSGLNDSVNGDLQFL